MEVAGTVRSVGDDVDTVGAGDRVLGMSFFGGYESQGSSEVHGRDATRKAMPRSSRSCSRWSVPDAAALWVTVIREPGVHRTFAGIGVVHNVVL
jgi:NADPH:quinone reductase-like Zn-dependent oxidoreductase